MRGSWIRVGGALALVVTLVACAGLFSGEFATDALPDTDWVLHGLDAGERRYSPLDEIERENVDRLGLVWSFDLHTRRGVEATPLIVDGVMYVTSSWSVVYALDAVTGALIWKYDPQVPRATLAMGCCDAVNRGVAWSDGRVFVGTYDGRLVALDARNGAPLWDVQTTDRESPYTITGAPKVAGDVVVIGNGGAELGVRGFVTGYDVASGEQRWRFYTVPGNPADGFENEVMERAAATWSGDWWTWGGGGTVWDSITYDPDLDLLYLGVGNGSPWNQTLRSPDGGDNLFLASIVALRPATGEYVWHYQTTPGETWDFTATQHMMLADLEIEGRPRKVLMQAPKNGFFYVLDRETGELISAEPYTLVNWASEIDPETGRPVETPNARVFDGEQVVVPSNGGGHNWPPMSFNPETGLVYIPTMIFPAAFKQPTLDRDKVHGGGLWNVGFDRMGSAPPPLPEAEVNKILDESFSGQLVAWDPVAQEARWKGPVGRPTGGGTLTTAGGLVFQGGVDGRFHAYDAETGADLWSFDVKTAAMAPPVTFARGGRQYVALAVGFGGGFAAEGGVVAHGWKIPIEPRVVVFALDGDARLPEVEVAARPLPEPAKPTADASVLALGQEIYQRQCSYCHGDGLRTGGHTPDLRFSPPEVHAIWEQIVLGGVLEDKGMVSFAKFVSPDQAEAIRQWVLAEAGRLYRDRNGLDAPKESGAGR